jgi:integrase/recombinase XerD
VHKDVVPDEGIEPPTFGLQNLIDMLSGSHEYAAFLGNSWGFRAREEREKRGQRAPNGHKSGHTRMTEANMYQRGETWFLRAEIAGRKYRESLHTANVKDARRLRDARLKTIHAQARHGAVAWADAVVAWAEHMKGQIAATTFRRYTQSLASCERHLLGRMVGEIDGAIVRGLVADRRRGGISNATARRDLTAISRVMAYAQSAGWREGNPALDAIRLLKERRDPIVLPDEGSIQAVFAKCSPALRSLATAARLTGARQAELTALKWSQFNEAAGTLEIIKGKGNRRRVITLSPAALAHLAGLERIGDVIFPSSEGPWTSVSPAFAKTVRRAAPRVRFRFHDLRHVYAVESLRSGVSIYRVSQHLGHTSVSTTEIYLAHLTPEEADKARQ